MIEQLSFDHQRLIAVYLPIQIYHQYRFSWKNNLPPRPTVNPIPYFESMDGMEISKRYSDHFDYLRINQQLVTDYFACKMLTYCQYSQLSTIKISNLSLDTKLLLVDNFEKFNQRFVLEIVRNVENKISIDKYLNSGEIPILFRWCESKYFECIEYYLSKGYSFDKIPILEYAVQHNEPKVVDVLLNQQNIENSTLLRCVGLAIKHKSWRIASILLKDARLGPSTNLDEILHMVIETGKGSQLLQQLMVDNRVDPSAKNNYAIRIAAKVGNTENVKLLLQSPSVDPTANDNEPIISAVVAGHFHIVQLLLNDKRVDPLAQNSAAMYIAKQTNRKDIVGLLQGRKPFQI
ncbi:hypothetical protein HDV01_007393 [Terramyces sp. JEL0728]|nr:hypothetical protein HDV01_007393 [Terramyces sp. JEL0728]